MGDDSDAHHLGWWPRVCLCWDEPKPRQQRDPADPGLSEGEESASAWELAVRCLDRLASCPDEPPSLALRWASSSSSSSSLRSEGRG